MVREYKNTDFDKVNKILKESFDLEKSYSELGSNFIELVYEKDNKAVGYVLLTKIVDPIKDILKFHVDYVCVDSEYRNQGIAKELMNYIDELAINNGVSKIELTSNSKRVAANIVYKEAGYQIVETNVYVKNL